MCSLVQHMHALYKGNAVPFFSCAMSFVTGRFHILWSGVPASCLICYHCVKRRSVLNTSNGWYYTGNYFLVSLWYILIFFLILHIFAAAGSQTASPIWAGPFLCFSSWKCIIFNTSQGNSGSSRVVVIVVAFVALDLLMFVVRPERNRGQFTRGEGAREGSTITWSVRKREAVICRAC